ncbi:3-hydroxybutyryl-CoA dehydrogenase [Fibrisoma limi BUZ 3]|uniref:3-hydroxybutyryl-CoA dehydrogenase n=1 Tax=Fibrisoma limi BUZ 3 TaxID=1185876 RepID=I2GF87_9BACT|nr:3-hydroxyacyl-CoA dehydrogenase [Fibrisoma limi]CCH52562.1 3-hydroxybutyryl-CoA dehydrogenase [Fibrisoma limi BUZ 3]
MDIKQVTVFGSGVLGSQIAFQTAFHEFSVTVYDLNDELLDKARNRFKELGEHFKRDLGATQDAIDATFQRLRYSTDMAQAVQDADLAIEAIPENVQIKSDFYLQLGKVAPARTIFATNSSTLLPSQFAEQTGRPDRFLALHFANNIWRQNTAEIMGHPGTDPAVFDTVVDFAKAIGMVALPIHKEQPGYILNSLLVPLLEAALRLYVKGVADPETIDKTWMIATGAPNGPFAIYDVVGLTTAYNITLKNAEATGDTDMQQAAQMLKENFIDKGKLGVATRAGFYTYPNPAFQQPDFLK